MAYLDTKSLNEDLKTAAHNLLVSSNFGYHLGNSKANLKGGVLAGIGILSGNPFAIGSSLLGGKNWIDKKYFSHHWSLSDDIKSKIASWCKAAGATAFKAGKSTSLAKSANLNNNEHEFGHAHTGLATRGFGKGMLTTSTTCIPISAGKDLYYYVYPTFDASDIFDIKALKQTGEDNYKVVELKQWKSIDHEQFKK